MDIRSHTKIAKTNHLQRILNSDRSPVERHLAERRRINRMFSSPSMEALDRINRMFSSPSMEALDRINRMFSSPSMEALDRINRMFSSPSMEALDRINRMFSSPSMEALDNIRNVVTPMSEDLDLSDLRRKSERVHLPAYVPAQHLGSRPFHEDTEQNDKDSLMVIRMSDLYPDTLMDCKTELSNQDYFHAVEEAIKGLLRKIRRITSLESDGIKLIEEAFAYKKKTPYIALNKLNTLSQHNVQEGFIHSLRGMIYGYRNPMAHESRLTWPLGDDEAISVLFQISEYHRRIDSRYIP